MGAAEDAGLSRASGRPCVHTCPSVHPSVHLSIRPSIRLGALFSYPGQVSLAALITPGPRAQVEEPGGRHTLALHTCRVPAPHQPRVGGTGWGAAGEGGHQLHPRSSVEENPRGPQREGNRPETTPRGAGGEGSRVGRARLGACRQLWAVLLTGAAPPQQQEREAAAGCAPTLLPRGLLPAQTLSRSFWVGASRGHCGHATRRSQKAHGYPGTRAPTLPKLPLEDWLSHASVRGGV